MNALIPRVIVVTRVTEYESLLARHAPHGQGDFFFRDLNTPAPVPTYKVVGVSGSIIKVLIDPPNNPLLACCHTVETFTVIVITFTDTSPCCRHQSDGMRTY